MELLQLQYFKTIAECQHITKAANKLMISQPSLSNTLSRIENELGVQLFDRQGRNIILNSYGRIVLEHANNILRELDNIRTEIDELQQRQKKVITIASTDSRDLRQWLPAFMTQSPDLTIHHFVSTTEKIEAGLLNGTIDFGILSNVPSDKAFGHLELWKDEFVVLSPLGSAIAQQPVRDFADFCLEPFVALPKSENLDRSIDILSNAAGFKPNIIFEGERELLERVLLPIRASIVVPQSVMQNDNDFKLCKAYCEIIRLNDPEAHLTITLAWDQRRSRSNSSQRLLNYLQSTPAMPWHLSTPDVVNQRKGTCIIKAREDD